jgi:hypothetical protein
LVVTLSTGEAIEAAMVGRDGVVGALAALDGRISISRAVVQISGHGAICEVEALKRAALVEINEGSYCPWLDHGSIDIVTREAADNVHRVPPRQH